MMRGPLQAAPCLPHAMRPKSASTVESPALAFGACAFVAQAHGCKREPRSRASPDDPFRSATSVFR